MKDGERDRLMERDSQSQRETERERERESGCGGGGGGGTGALGNINELMDEGRLPRQLPSDETHTAASQW